MMAEHAVAIAWRGSYSHGTYIPNVIDDKDLIAVHILPLDHYFGLRRYFGLRDTIEVKEGEWDIVCYEFRKLVSLLKKGNPNVIALLHQPGRQFIEMSAEFFEFRRNAHLFNSKQIYKSFIGYANTQMYKMTHLAFEGYMGEKRKALVQKFGYDTKNAAHLIRLMRMAVEWLETLKFTVQRHDAKELIQIKTGEWELARVKEEADRLFKLAEQKFEKCTLPEEPDHAAIDKLCVKIIGDHYGRFD